MLHMGGDCGFCNIEPASDFFAFQPRGHQLQDLDLSSGDVGVYGMAAVGLTSNDRTRASSLVVASASASPAANSEPPARKASPSF